MGEGMKKKKRNTERERRREREGRVMRGNGVRKVIRMLEGEWWWWWWWWWKGMERGRV